VDDKSRLHKTIVKKKIASRLFYADVAKLNKLSRFKIFVLANRNRKGTKIFGESYDENGLPLSFYETIGFNIRLARQKADLSQGELARLVQIDQSTLSRIENGIRSYLDVEHLYVIAVALNCSIIDFLPCQIKM
jgi:DNA-binding XRE family transcriptional regulator